MKNVNQEEVMLIISKMLCDIIGANIPHEWMPAEEPFVNPYKESVSYDYSGIVVKIDKNNFNDLIESLGSEDSKKFFISEFEEMLQCVYINQWTPSYESNRGKNWITYGDLLQSKYDEWKYENFELCDEDGNEINEELEFQLDTIFDNFIKNTQPEFYSRRILKSIF